MVQSGLLLELVIKATLVTVLGTLVVVVVLRRSSAAWRHQVWAATLVSVLALPVLAASLPGWDVDMQRRAGVTPESAHQETARFDKATLSDSTTSTTVGGQQRAPGWLLLAWLVGTASVAVWLIAGIVGARRLKRESQLLEGERWRRVLKRAMQRAGAGLGTRLAIHSLVETPVLVGIVKPIVALPPAVAEWPDGRLEDVLVHELAHVVRADNVLNLLGRMACALFWFHPLVWFAAHRLRVEREHAADDVVIVSGQNPTEYAHHLLTVARNVRSPRPDAAVALVSKLPITKRIVAILDAGRRHHAVPKRAGWFAMLFAAAIMLPVACASSSTSPASPHELALVEGKPLATFNADGAMIDLLAVDVPASVKRREAFPMSLYWRVRTPFRKSPSHDERWKVFVHFEPTAWVSSTGAYVSAPGLRFQGDHSVVAPGKWWLNQGVVEDHFAVMAGHHSGYDKGKYAIWVGWYNRRGGDWHNAPISNNGSRKHQETTGPGGTPTFHRLHIGDVTVR